MAKYQKMAKSKKCISVKKAETSKTKNLGESRMFVTFGTR